MAQALDIVTMFATLEAARRESRLTLGEGVTVQGQTTTDQRFYQVSARIPIIVNPDNVDGLDVIVDDTSIVIAAPAP